MRQRQEVVAYQWERERVWGGGEGIGRGMWRKKDIYITVLSTGDVFYSRVYMFYVYLSSDCKVLCNN